MRKSKELKWEMYEEIRKILIKEIEEMSKELEAKEKELRHVKMEMDKIDYLI